MVIFMNPNGFSDIEHGEAYDATVKFMDDIKVNSMSAKKRTELAMIILGEICNGISVDKSAYDNLDEFIKNNFTDDIND